MQLNIIAAISSTGNLYYTVNRGMNNSETILVFILKVIRQLDLTDPEWRSHTVFMLDNAPYHRSATLLDRLKELKLQVMYLGPYQFNMAPVEKLFSILKQRDLNPFKSNSRSLYPLTHNGPIGATRNSSSRRSPLASLGSTGLGFRGPSSIALPMLYRHCA